MFNSIRERRMIPTRLNQEFKNGYLSGFNSETGNLLVVSNTNWEIGYGTVSSFNDTVSSILADKPGWILPSITDLESLHPYPNAEYFIKGVQRLQRYESVYISSRSQDHTLRNTVIQLRVGKLKERCTTSNIESIFVPVFYISGRNCDQILSETADLSCS